MCQRRDSVRKQVPGQPRAVHPRAYLEPKAAGLSGRSAPRGHRRRDHEGRRLLFEQTDGFHAQHGFCARQGVCAIGLSRCRIHRLRHHRHVVLAEPDAAALDQLSCEETSERPLERRHLVAVQESLPRQLEVQHAAEGREGAARRVGRPRRSVGRRRGFREGGGRRREEGRGRRFGRRQRRRQHRHVRGFQSRRGLRTFTMVAEVRHGIAWDDRCATARACSPLPPATASARNWVPSTVRTTAFGREAPPAARGRQG